ncbi:MAG: hypothetical protein RIC80_05675, partial [Cyclobacteriaceae bacterium]
VVMLSACENEDNLRAPDFYTPVVLLATNVTNNVWETSELPNTAFTFTLDEENFDGAADGHKFFVGRSGVTSTLLDVTLLASMNGGSPEPVATFQGSELPAEVSISASDIASTFGMTPDDLAPGDVIAITYEYNIDADNSGTVYKLGTPGNDYCGGFTNEGEWCTFTISVVCSLADVVQNPAPGAYVIDMQDSFGDGWNGATLEVTVDGVTSVITVDAGSSGSETINIAPGTSTFEVAFTSGDFDSEVTFQVLDPAGNVMADEGPTPSVGTVTLSVCL